MIFAETERFGALPRVPTYSPQTSPPEEAHFTRGQKRLQPISQTKNIGNDAFRKLRRGPLAPPPEGPLPFAWPMRQLRSRIEKQDQLGASSQAARHFRRYLRRQLREHSPMQGAKHDILSPICAFQTTLPSLPSNLTKSNSREEVTQYS